MSLNIPEKKLVKLLAEDMASQLNRSTPQLLQAWQEGIKAQKTFEDGCSLLGPAIIEKAQKEGKKINIPGRTSI